MPKIRVLIVDGSMVMRQLISEALGRDPGIEVAGVAASGRLALQRIPQIHPDLVTVDADLPDMDGLSLLRELRKTCPQLPVILFSTPTARGAVATLDALAAGATDYVARPAGPGQAPEGLERWPSELVAKIKLHCRFARLPPLTPPHRVAAGAESPAALPVPASPVDVVCMAASTGGPNALAEVFRDFPAGFHLPILIVQHMPPVFTAKLADRLTALGSVPCHEGVAGQPVKPGHAYLAPGGKHMEVRRLGANVMLHLHEGPMENACRPAADVLFRSAVTVYGGRILGVVMTGMGQDGLRGCELIREAGGQVIVQDEATSVIWGMPGCVAMVGCADKVVPLDQLAREIRWRTRFPWAVPSRA